jgi:hypothetical protein
VTIKEKRGDFRYSYKADVSYIALGGSAQPPDKKFASAEILDLSNNGARIRLKRRVLKEGTMLQVRIPMPGIQVTVPTLAEVRWMKEQSSGHHQVGLIFVVR